MTTTAALEWVTPDALAGAVSDSVRDGGRFAGVFATPAPTGEILLRAILSEGPDLTVLVAELPAGRDGYPSLSPLVPAAFWYERVIHDLFGVVPSGHPRLDPLAYPLAGRSGERPRPGRSGDVTRVDPDTFALAGHVEGEGVFTIPYGPVRSGVFEAVEYLVETFGEDIPRVRVRPYVKHRGMGARFAGMSPEDGVLLSERVEGTMSVAHACAFSQAIESLAGVEPPPASQLQRVVHAELERIANHLDSTIRHAEGAGQAVAYARLSWEKERILRLQARLCGHRFGRGLIRPGGTAGPPQIGPAEAAAETDAIRADVAIELRSLMTTPSFLDRLRATGPIPPEEACAHGAVGPVGRASGTGPDVRSTQPYGAYRQLVCVPAELRHEGDALARQWVRVEEIAEAFNLAGRALSALSEVGAGPWSVPVPVPEGTSLARVESPQGELVYLVDCDAGRLANVRVRTASFHNFALFSSAFRGDIFTDFVFIEASFGVNMAGVAG